MTREIHKTTSGKVRVIEKKQLTDLRTGEHFEAITITKDFNSDSGFKKMFLGELLSIVDEFSSAKMKFILWLLNNIDHNNQIIGTYPVFAKQSKVSETTISRLIPVLKNAKVLKQIQIGVYMINPDIVSSVKASKRQNLLIRYKDLRDENQIDIEDQIHSN